METAEMRERLWRQQAGVPEPHAIGNVVSLCGSGFLLGPKRQLRNMTRAKRRWAAAVYLLTMVITLVVRPHCVFASFGHAIVCCLLRCPEVPKVLLQAEVLESCIAEHRSDSAYHLKIITYQREHPNNRQSTTALLHEC